MADADSRDALVDRVTSFVADNKRAIVAGAAAAVAVGGVGYYLYTHRGPGGPSSSPKDVERNDAAPDEQAGTPAKKKSKGKKRKTTKEKDGPILEERKPKSTAASVSDATEDVPASIKELEPKLAAAQISAMPESERLQLAATYKSRGNECYKKQKYEVAAELYTRAIDVSPRPDAMYYSNRSACYLYFKPPRYDLVIEDCTAALAIDKLYIKPLTRRASAYETTGRLHEALRDFTASVILDRFKTEATNAALDRCLKSLASKVASETLKSREPRLPSATFIAAFFASFRPQPKPPLPESPTQGDTTFDLALDALAASDYTHCLSLTTEALEQGISTPLAQAYAYNLKGTFFFLMGDTPSAKAAFEASIKALPSFTNSHVKLASVFMDMGDAESTMKQYELALAANPRDPDIYYQRGQVHFIMGQYERAAQDYQKSTDMDDKFVFSHIQLAVAQYKLGDTGTSMKTFRKTMRNFPNMSEPFNYYGELLLDQGNFDEAVKKFDEAIAIEKKKTAHFNVLPIVNKGLAMFQWKNDFRAAEKLCKEALEIDPECEAAIATLAQLLLQHARLDEAVEMFGRHVTIARSEMELNATLNYKLATEAQLEFVRNYPERAEMLSEVARSLQ
ncbi:ADP/ATP carrier receptor [Exidia glandulosa HHB12029]|uniref:ADP/ATP carrier receptor n=1 Tax=Exidia glandulosa HHB12029 TaxID=1314781 RepID=A0A166B8L3_EXIGL|nr:ADP/ATP carrier receptor [Exidia glandulosa HHB12029]